MEQSKFFRQLFHYVMGKNTDLEELALTAKVMFDMMSCPVSPFLLHNDDDDRLVGIPSLPLPPLPSLTVS